MRVTTRATWQMLPDGGFELIERDSYEYTGPVAEAKGGKETQTNTVDIPSFLKPFMNQSASVGQSSLGNLQQLLGGNLVAGFNPVQQQAQQQAIDLAGGAGGFLPTAQNAFMNVAQGQNFLPPFALNALNQGAQGQNFLPQQSMQTLQQLGQGGALPGTETLQQTANGDFLFGGQGFDQAVQAAVRAAQPGIRSTFGSAGPGASSGGLAQAAIGQSAVDAFARQFGIQRQQQLNAANQLAQLGLQGRNQQLGAIGQQANIGQGQNAQQLAAATQLGQFGGQQQQQQLTAAAALPNIATTGINLLSGVGAQQQALEQQQIDAPIQGQQALLQSSMAAPGAFAPLFGSTTTQETESSPLSSLLGAGLTAASIFGTGGLGLLGGAGGAMGGFGALSGGLGGGMTASQLMGTSSPLSFFTSPMLGG